MKASNSSLSKRSNEWLELESVSPGSWCHETVWWSTPVKVLVGNRVAYMCFENINSFHILNILKHSMLCSFSCSWEEQLDYRDHNCFSIPKTDDNLPEIFKFSMFHYYRNQIKILPASFNLNGFCKEKIIFRNVHFGKKKS